SANQPVMPDDSTTARMVSRQEPSIKRVEMVMAGNTQRMECALHARKIGLQIDDKPATGHYGLPACRGDSAIQCHQVTVFTGRAVDELGGGQPVVIRIPGKHELAALQAIDHHARHFRAYRGAAMAATDTAVAFDPARINIVGRVNDDGALPGQVVDARLQAIHAQRITMRAEVAFLSAEQADTRLVAPFD